MKPSERLPNPDLIFGSRAIIETIKAGKDLNKILLQKDFQSDLNKELRDLAREYQIPVQLVPKEKLNAITTKNHQGVIGFGSPVSYYNIADLLPRIYEMGETPLIIALDRVTDVRNFGAIARSAACAGAHGILVPAQNSALVTSDALKTSAGALASLPVCKEVDFKAALRYLKASGLQIVAADQHATTPVFKADLLGPTVILMGSEDEGIGLDLMRMADQLVTIPITGVIESLNVSVAAGVFLFEAVRQRLGAE